MELRIKKLLEDHGLSRLSPDLSKAAAIRSKLLHGTHVGRSAQQNAAEKAREVAKAVLTSELEKCGVNTEALLQ